MPHPGDPRNIPPLQGNPYGDNIHPFGPQGALNLEKFYRYIQRAKPNFVIVNDLDSVAFEVKRRSPQTTPIFRTHDTNPHEDVWEYTARSAGVMKMGVFRALVLALLTALLAFADPTIIRMALIAVSVSVAAFAVYPVLKAVIYSFHTGKLVTVADAQGARLVRRAYTPARFIDHHRPFWNSGVAVLVGNEVGNGPGFINWVSDLVELNAAMGYPLILVVGNFSVGTPEPDDWRQPHMIRLLRLLDAHRSHTLLGLHEYFDTIAVSGWRGVPPPNAPGIQDLSRWSKFALFRNAAGKIEPHWHCGRFVNAFIVCDGLGIGRPRVVMTEHFSDKINDMNQFVDNLPGVPKSGDTRRGANGVKAQWKLWWPEKTASRAGFDLLIFLWEHLYSKYPEIEGLLLFCVGNSGYWENFDLSAEEWDELRELLIAYFSRVRPEPQPEPEPEPGTCDHSEAIRAIRDVSDVLGEAIKVLDRAIAKLG